MARMLHPSFEQALQAFLAKAELLLEEEHGPGTITLLEHTFHQKKYVKILTVPHGSVFCWIDKSSGDILAPEDQSHPARNARGNIYAPSAELAIDTLGTVRRRPQ